MPLEQARTAEVQEEFRAMSNLGDAAGNLINILTLAANLTFAFAAVSFVAGAVTDGIAGVLQWKGNLLLAGVKGLLNDPMFTGLARAIYNNSAVNPRSDGTAETEAQIKYKPASIDAMAFGIALLELLHVVPAAPQPGETFAPVDHPIPANRVKNAIQNATQVIEKFVSNEKARADFIQLTTNLVERYQADQPKMEQATAAWFDRGVQHVSVDYRKRTQISNFFVAFLFAMLLDLQPIPIGGFTAVLSVGAKAPSATAIASLVPIIGNIAEWTVVAAATLLGAQFWYSAYQSFVGIQRTVQAVARPEAAGPAPQQPGAQPGGPTPPPQTPPTPVPPPQTPPSPIPPPPPVPPPQTPPSPTSSPPAPPPPVPPPRTNPE